MLAVAALFAVAVLSTGMPVSALLTQHRQLSSSSASLARLQAEDAALSAEAKGLTDPNTVSGLARSDYGLVPPGQKAYVVLPPSGASPSAVAGSGHVPLEGPPVVPGSAQSQALLGLGTTSTTAPAPNHSATGHGAPVASSTGGGFWHRVLRTLEFWR
jgi:cell division protein FtsB